MKRVLINLPVRKAGPDQLHITNTRNSAGGGQV